MSTPPTTRSATRLLGLGLTPGKLRGLQRISNPDGTLTMLALDQNASMINMIKAGLEGKRPDPNPTYEEVVEAKVTLARALGPHCSAVLTDAYYGYWSTVAAHAVPAGVGTLVRVERSGGVKNKFGAPLGAVEPGWSVEKVKRCGADALKLLAQFEPTEMNSAEHQFKFVREVHEQCRKHDLLMLLEPLAFPFGGEQKDSRSFLDRKPQTVIETARILSPHCDVYKSEFPGTLGHESEGQLRQNLEELSAACQRPWVLLSAGVDFPQYRQQVEMAMGCGASGVLGGRAFWKEFFTYPTPEERLRFAQTECVDRVKEIDGLVKDQGTPWFARYGLGRDELHSMRAAEGWHVRYPGTAAAGGAAAGPVGKDEEY